MFAFVQAKVLVLIIFVGLACLGRSCRLFSPVLSLLSDVSIPPPARRQEACAQLRHLQLLRTCGLHGYRYVPPSVPSQCMLASAACTVRDASPRHGLNVILCTKPSLQFHASLTHCVLAGTNCVFGEHARPANETAAIH